ncbi:hypothetical protein ACN38_g1621 [Penicillium nordicum]|uniref:Uncharacterized protein n=1 Tax=Penicillium nordicum TaxID=229535 RepID=A0A0M8PBG0_9EURO|nr:hypothetical protein ACN38_g1621 [Penicillium nordicum]
MVDGSYKPFSDERNDRKPVFECLLSRRRHHRTADVALKHQRAGKLCRTNCIGMAAVMYGSRCGETGVHVAYTALGIMSTRILGILMPEGFLLKDIQSTSLNRNLFWSKSGGVSGAMVGVESSGATNVRVPARLR